MELEGRRVGNVWPSGAEESGQQPGGRSGAAVTGQPLEVACGPWCLRPLGEADSERSGPPKKARMKNMVKKDVNVVADECKEMEGRWVMAVALACLLMCEGG